MTSALALTHRLHLAVHVQIHIASETTSMLTTWVVTAISMSNKGSNAVWGHEV